MAVAAAHRDPRISSVVLIGSLARGTATAASDADVIVVLEEAERRRVDRVPPLLKLFEESPLPLDLHPYTREEWEAARNRRDALCRRAEEDGIDLLAD